MGYVSLSLVLTRSPCVPSSPFPGPPNVMSFHAYLGGKYYPTPDWGVRKLGQDYGASTSVHVYLSIVISLIKVAARTASLAVV